MTLGALRRIGVSIAVAAFVLAGCGGGDEARTAETLATTTTAAPLAAPEVSGGGTVSVTTPPAAGTYTYDQTGTTLVKDQGQQPKTRDATGTLVVSAPTQGSDGAEVKMEREEGSGTKQLQTLLYNDKGISIVYVKNYLAVVNKIEEFECKPDRPVLILPVGIGPGSTWQDRVSCGSNGQIEYSATVAAEEPVTLGDGSATDALKIDVSIKVTATGSRTLHTQSKETFWFSPAARLQVKIQDDTSAQLSVYDIERHSVDVLQTTTPR